jgi:starch phosphorylase
MAPENTTTTPSTLAYFSMEVGLDPAMPTYSGGLGMLAGDMLRAAADSGVPMVGVTLLHRLGYFTQHLDQRGSQTESPTAWKPEDHLELLDPLVTVSIEGRTVALRAWRYLIRGVTGHVVPVYLLDASRPQNEVWDQTLTDSLYGGDERYRLCQEVILGLGGVAMLRALGYRDGVFHMNEGHSALLALALLKEQTMERGAGNATAEEIEQVRQRCVFTTHTPVPAGHDQFTLDAVRRTLGDEDTDALVKIGCCPDNVLNMTFMGLFFSRYINGVSMRHEEISRGMFPHYPINAVTNGVHGITWTSDALAALFDEHVPEWRRDNRYLRYAVSIPPEKIWEAHLKAKRQLAAEVKRRTERSLDPHTFTIGFARRAAPYKRANLLLSDLERLRRIGKDQGPLQILYAGKAHPHDEMGKDMIRNVFAAAAALEGSIPVVYLEDYDMALGRLLCAGVDLWLNTPKRPQEASGTSGMKAALNGIPSFSVLDGWWIEGHVEGVTGWSIGSSGGNGDGDEENEIASLHDKLEYIILPMFYGRPEAWRQIMRMAISLNGSFFNAQRMVSQYLQNAYPFPALSAATI